jgi:uncharacterized protein (DUF1015 family)
MASGIPIHEFGGPDGVAYRLWPIIDEERIQRIADLLRHEVMFIADGHHRYETALRYRDLHRPKGLPHGSAPEDFLLVFCLSVRNPGLKILPTHRLVKAEGVLDPAALRTSLAQRFNVQQRAVRGPEGLSEALRSIAGESDWIGCYTQPEQLLILSPKSADALDDLLPARSPDWRRLPVAQLHYGVLQPLLGIAAEGGGPQPRLAFSQDIEAMYWHVAGRRFDAAFFLPSVQPTTIERIARAGERMPPKSTFFYPKLLSGLAFYSFDQPNGAPQVPDQR